MSQPMPQPTLPVDAAGGKPTNFRWVICGLLFYATTVNYIDRSTLGSLEPTLRDSIHWRTYQYGLIGAAFSLAYGIGFLVMGSLVDKAGTRIGYAIAMLGWSISGLCTAFTSTPMQFGITRFFLGLFEAGNFPAAIKTTAEWFPQKQRATATGIFNAGSNVGAVVAPIIVMLLVSGSNWRPAFFVTPILVIIWLFFWLRLYRPPAQQPRANAAERALIEADPAVMPAPVKWRNILPHPQAWAFMAGKFLTDPIWWFYLFWAGKFLNAKFHVQLTGVAGPLIYIYVLADFGSIGGGWLSSMLIRRGMTPNLARKIAMLVCAAFVVPVIFAPKVPSDMAGGLWIAATLLGSAAAAHQGFSANIFTTTSDMFPKRAVSSVTGLGGLAGALGSVLLQSIAGVTIELTNNDYFPLFVVAALSYPLAILLIHLFAPRMARVSDERLETVAMPRAITAFVFAILGLIVAVPLSFFAQEHESHRLYSVNKMVAYTYEEVTDDLPKPLKDLVLLDSSNKLVTKVTEGKEVLTSDEKQKLLEQTPASPDFAALLNRSDLKIKSESYDVSFKGNLSDADLAAVRAAYHVTDSNSRYTPKVADADPAKSKPAMLSIPFAVTGPASSVRFPNSFGFSSYMAAALPPGDLYQSIDRDKLVKPLIWTPLVGLGIGAIVGAVLHGLIFRPRRTP